MRLDTKIDIDASYDALISFIVATKSSPSLATNLITLLLILHQLYNKHNEIKCVCYVSIS